jgi:hypothetical protein
MSSPFFSELTKLDSSLRTVQSQVDRLRSGLDENEDQLKQSVAEARQHACALRNLILAENADAKWSDREALEHLVLASEVAAEERRVQQRRTRLLQLAAELEAGNVKHRTRAAALNALRLQAVTQLRELAAQKDQDKELPGPEAGQWVHWVCNLQEDKDAAVIAELREHFSALDEFAANIEEGFWVAGERAVLSPSAVQTSASTTQPPIAAVAEPIAHTSIAGAPLPQEVKAHFDKAVHTGDFSEALSLCYEATASETVPAAPAGQEPVSTAEAAPPLLKYCSECGRTYPSRYKVCPFDSAALQDLPESAPEMPEIASLPERYKIPAPVLKQPSGADGATDAAEAGKVTSPTPVVQLAEASAIPEGEPSPADSVPSSAPASFATFDEVGSRKKPIGMWLAVAAVIVLSAIFIGTYYLPSGSKKSAQMQVAQAAVNGEAAPAVAKPLLHIQPAEGAQDNILLSMENCEHATPSGIECWGYISNQRDKDSKISLDRVNVIDGKGNSFDLSSKGQTTFSDVHDFTVPAQSKVKYSIKVPDTDKEARTLTLYLDVNNPRGSEYTFRDVPVSD